MTPLTKNVSRRTVAPHRGRRIVVTLAPGDLIGFREEKTRTTYWTTLAACADLAVKQHSAAVRAEKKKSMLRK
jgi:hypothetical protein